MSGEVKPFMAEASWLVGTLPWRPGTTPNSRRVLPLRQQALTVQVATLLAAGATVVQVLEVLAAVRGIDTAINATAQAGLWKMALKTAYKIHKAKSV